MTDLDILTSCFGRVGIAFTVVEAPADYTPGEGFDFPISKIVKVESGIGYTGLYTDFYFDDKGKFIAHGIWEAS